MTGPEHYREAERLLGPVTAPSGSFTLPKAPDVIATAQVHAVLALAATTALAHHNFETGPPQADKDAWYRVASEGPGYKQRLREAEAAEERESKGHS
jgi:hypothetical protein